MKLNNKIASSTEMISLLELKLLMTAIIAQRAKIRIKCLLEGVWTKQFFSVMMITDKGIVLSDDSNRKIKNIRFLDQVSQFVIDKPFDSYNSDLAYGVK
jgi:hypothetical protein